MQLFEGKDSINEVEVAVLCGSLEQACHFQEHWL